MPEQRSRAGTQNLRCRIVSIPSCKKRRRRCLYGSYNLAVAGNEQSLPSAGANVCDEANRASLKGVTVAEHAFDRAVGFLLPQHKLRIVRAESGAEPCRAVCRHT